MTFAPASLPARRARAAALRGSRWSGDDQPRVDRGRHDAAFAALKTRAPVIEGMGLRNFGAHSNSAEYVNISSIEPRLYLLTRLIMDIAAGTAGIATIAGR